MLIKKLGQLDNEIVTQTDNYGNNILHMAVIQNLPGMIQRISKLNEISNTIGLTTVDALHTKVNNTELTPLALAADLDHFESLEALINERRTLRWKYASISAYLHPIHDLVVPNGALEIIVRKKHINMLQHPFIASCFVKLWDYGMEKQFYTKMIKWIAYMVLLTYTSFSFVGVRGGRQVLPSLLASKISHGCTSVGVVSFAADKLKVELDELWTFRGRKYLTGVSSTEFIENFFSLVSCSTSIMCIMSHYLNIEPLERLLSALSILSGCFYMLFFFLGFRRVGTLVIVMLKLFVDEVLVFSMAIFLFVFGFTSFFFHITGAVTFGQFVEHFDRSFQTILGDYDLQDYRTDRYSLLTSSFSVLYALFISVTLLNTLVAKMSSDYELIQQNEGKFWMVERGRIMLSMANELHPKGIAGILLDGVAAQKESPIILQKFWVEDEFILKKKKSKKRDFKEEDLRNVSFEYHEVDEEYYSKSREVDEDCNEITQANPESKNIKKTK